MRLSPQEIERLPQVEGVLNYLAPLALGDASSVPFADFVASDLVYRLIWRSHYAGETPQPTAADGPSEGRPGGP